MACRRKTRDEWFRPKVPVRAMTPQAGDRLDREGNQVLVLGFGVDGRVLYRCASRNGAAADCAVTLEEWKRLVRNTLDARTEFIPANTALTSADEGGVS